MKNVIAKGFILLQKQDMSYPNFGSVFSNYNERIMKFVRVTSKLDGKNKYIFLPKNLIGC